MLLREKEKLVGTNVEFAENCAKTPARQKQLSDCVCVLLMSNRWCPVIGTFELISATWLDKLGHQSF